MLVADIGNTDILFGVFDGERLSHTYRVPSKKEESTVFFEYGLHNFFLENNISANQFQKTVLSSVVPELTPIIEEILNRLSISKTIVVKAGIHPDVSVSIENPDELGLDLYCNAVSAYSAAKSACIVVDFGTALTFTAVSNNGEVLGVAITPGLKTAVYALFSKTSQLPEVPLEFPDKAIGRNTLNSIQSGVLYGYEGLVRNLLTHFKKEIGTPCKVYATGGLSSILKGLQTEFDDVDINLTLKGLRIIGEAV
ncbi:type III pantothenate kinase [uncultured Arcticibacterium sp.]|uniref:type III pantothenate kinase n=1 Tax=uncultured Arcticibacterium sp. TaxID=2173042 RepID=UPI0030FCB17D